MTAFLKSFAYFLSVPALLTLITLCLPTTPKVKGSLLFAQINKERVLQNAKVKKLVLVGGSNLSFGIDSKAIEQKFNVLVVNMGLQASIGADFQVRSVLPYLNKGDVLITSLEYNNFFGNFAYGSEPLLRLALDVNRDEFKSFNYKNYFATLSYLPQYCLSKLDPRSYIFKPNAAERIYSVEAFNTNGDAVAHYGLPPVAFSPEPQFTGAINTKLIDQLEHVHHQLALIGVQMFLSFPPFEEQSYSNSADQIQELHQQLQKKNLELLGSPIQRKLPRTLFFNTPYHLSQEGVAENTDYLIRQISFHTF